MTRILHLLIILFSIADRHQCHHCHLHFSSQLAIFRLQFHYNEHDSSDMMSVWK